MKEKKDINEVKTINEDSKVFREVGKNSYGVVVGSWPTLVLKGFDKDKESLVMFSVQVEGRHLEAVARASDEKQLVATVTKLFDEFSQNVQDGDYIKIDFCNVKSFKEVRDAIYSSESGAQLEFKQDMFSDWKAIGSVRNAKNIQFMATQYYISFVATTPNLSVQHNSLSSHDAFDKKTLLTVYKMFKEREKNNTQTEWWPKPFNLDGIYK